MMDQTHIGYTYWQEPPQEHDAARRHDPGADAPPRWASRWWRRTARRRCATRAGRFARELSLPTFDPYTRPTYHIDVYNRGKTAFAFTASSAEPWVVVSPAKGTITKEKRLSVSVDWKKAPVGANRVPITITGPKGAKTVVQAPVDNPVIADARLGLRIRRDRRATSRSTPSISRAKWRPLHSIWLRDARASAARGGAITPIPVTSPSVTPGGNSPRLEYDLFLFDSGTVQVHAYLSPTLNFTGSPTGLRYAVSIDDEPPQIVNAWTDTTQRTWEHAGRRQRSRARCRRTRSRGPAGTC